MMNCFNVSCQGYLHKEENKICQDYSCSMDKDDIAVLIVCDGHDA
jgi:hypothetical protein